jgi:DNA-binding NarL/FixJ family response regulator
VVVSRTAREDEMTAPSCSCGQRATAGLRVLVVDDHPMVRTALSEMLSDEDGVTVVGECADGSQVVEAVTRLRPDVVLMDYSMPEMNGLAATEALRAAHLQSQVIMLTAEDSIGRPTVAAAGADGLLPKSARTDALLRCLRSVVLGCGCCPYCL